MLLFISPHRAASHTPRSATPVAFTRVADSEANNPLNDLPDTSFSPPNILSPPCPPSLPSSLYASADTLVACTVHGCTRAYTSSSSLQPSPRATPPLLPVSQPLHSSRKRSSVRRRSVGPNARDGAGGGVFPRRHGEGTTGVRRPGPPGGPLRP